LLLQSSFTIGTEMNATQLSKTLKGLVLAISLLAASASHGARVLTSDLATFSVSVPDVEVFATPSGATWQANLEFSFDPGTSIDAQLLSFIIAFEGPVSSLSIAPSLPLIAGSGLSGCANLSGGCFSYELDPAVLPVALGSGSINATVTFAGASSTRYAFSALIADAQGDLFLTDFLASPDTFAPADNTGMITAIITVIPEPSEWLLMLAGLGAMGMVTRRKRMLSATQ
jgi:hypothetical protein